MSMMKVSLEVIEETLTKLEKMKYEGQNVYLNKAITNIINSLDEPS